jgi:hypothetical protein
MRANDLCSGNVHAHDLFSQNLSPANVPSKNLLAGDLRPGRVFSCGVRRSDRG